MEIGQTVSLKINGEQAFGWVRTAPVLTASGQLVKVELLPDFVHLMPTGWTDANVADLVAVKICGCATLGYRPTWGDHKGELFTTGCDFSRTPRATFLPGHDAKAKSFLIRASGETATLTNGLGALETARQFSDKIEMAVAKGMDRARTGRAKRPAAPRTEAATPAQQLQRELKVTPTMTEALANGLVRYDGEVVSLTTSTLTALQTRGLVEKGGRGITRLGRQVMDYDLTPEKPVCTAADGVYPAHWNTWSHEVGYHCRRCGTADANP
jgi:hypothetical protein